MVTKIIKKSDLIELNFNVPFNTK